MPKTIDIGTVAVSKSWTITAYTFSAPAVGVDPLDGTVSVLLRVDTIADGEVTGEANQRFSVGSRADMTRLMTLIGTKMSTAIGGGASLMAAYHTATRDALYEIGQALGAIPAEAE